jgi:hypothetical protein
MNKVIKRIRVHKAVEKNIRNKSRKGPKITLLTYVSVTVKQQTFWNEHKDSKNSGPNYK